MNSLPRKINTIPRGSLLFWTLCVFSPALMLFCCVILQPAPEAWICVAVALGVEFLGSFYIYRIKCWNFVCFSKEGVSHRKTTYTWSEACITIKYQKSLYRKLSYDYYIYFSDHYLSEKECQSKKLRKEGFYLILTAKRLDLLLSLYPKKVRIINELPGRHSKNILDRIKWHNFACLEQDRFTAEEL